MKNGGGIGEEGDMGVGVGGGADKRSTGASSVSYRQKKISFV